jgi:excisionase family DNA binding protein
MPNVQRVNTTNAPAENPFGLQKAAYGITETVELLSIGRSSLYALIRRRELEPVKLGKKTLFLAPDLTRFLNRLRGA